ncbi:holocarboxylase synthetase [Gossypium australe]|uniref:Holocarboxylase synthetase n=1 Tax=Gossypium australe TaxID=47621 RepID=A0A5B6UGW3_9ROSI|nr:holocarboxylase synthetase [Gossypium australe]
MSKKRKSDATRLDEVSRSMYTAFCSAANSLSQLYSHSMNHQSLSFQAGERYALEELFEWILRQQEEGLKVMTTDIVAYLQENEINGWEDEEFTVGAGLMKENELEYGAEDFPMSPRQPFQQQQQHPRPATHQSNLGSPFSSNPISAGTIAQGVRSADYQAKNSVFSSALSSPVRQSLQHYHSVPGANNISSSTNEPRDNETYHTNLQNRETDSPSTNDCMDMHADDSPHQDFPF